ncbi:glycosyltransferase [Weissella confusa]|uniref:Glycosyltransferase n=1 Tax=Weissella confusa TaxID=1583 RepID=A0A4Z0RIP4_WEICO|nr:glycosyltransferase [Weissella confusa]KRN23232.1 hypothetical protein IV69_GL001661 [Weissella confusa]MBJ7632502.1 glycosyltransferase [Weissella confusa]MBJ7638638.1 glycosyltransferase [Weissella confusa]MBJ7641510.1 glycosyltransferase [Weissella confusa]MBJ7645507.1 glycosyltransferase [Weissella confusa]
MTKKLVTVMATYNGAAFIEEQVHSIFNQSYDGEMKLLVHDDGSTDDTIEKLKTLAQNYPIDFLMQGEKLGVQQAFMRLIEATIKYKPDAVFLSDQDDIWSHDKVSQQIQQVRDWNKPILVFTNYDLIDGSGREIEAKAGQQLPTGFVRKSMYDLLFNPIVTGNNVMINRAFLTYLSGKGALKASVVTMHDHLISLMALENDGLYYLNTSTVKYRQHGSNVVGAGKQKIVERGAKDSKAWVNLKNTLEMLPLFSSMEQIQTSTLLFRMKWLLKHRVTKHSLVNTIGLYYYVLLKWRRA